MGNDHSRAPVTETAATFVGREAALGAVGAAVAARERLVVFDVTGTGGVGKSALLDELERRLRGAGARVVRARFAEFRPAAETSREDLLTAYRGILETLALDLDPERGRSFREAARASALRASGSAGIDVAHDEIRDAFVDLVGESDAPVAVLGDDVSAAGGATWLAWLVDLLNASARAAPLVAVLTRAGGPAERIAYPGRVVPLPLGPLTREETEGCLPDRAWAEAVDRWCGRYPAAVVLASELARDHPGRPEVLNDPAVVVPRGRRLLDALLESLGEGVEREAIEVAAVARRFDIGLLGAALAGERATAPAYLEDWLARLPFVEPLDSGAYRLRPFLRLLLGDHLRTQPPRRAAQVGSRLDELHELVTEAYEQRVVEDAQDRRYASWLTLEDVAKQERQLEFLHHALLGSDDRRRRGWLGVVHAYLDAFWWWGAYLESDFCRRLLAGWERQARPVDRPLLDALKLFHASYPPATTGRPGEWDGVRRAVTTIGQVLLPDEPARMTLVERHVRAILDVFAAQAQQHLDARSPAADASFARAYELFAGDPEDAWCVPWVILHQGELAVARGRHEEAEALARRGLERAGAVAPADRDWEVEAGLHRLLADALWTRRERWTAFRHLARALFCAYSFTSLPDPPDEYTRAFYRETADAVVDRIVALLPDTGAAQRACRAFATFWAPYWEVAGAPPDERSIDALLERSPRDVSLCIFPPEPSDEDLEYDGPYAETARRVHERLGPALDEAVDVFGEESVAARLRSRLRRRRASARPEPLDLPAQPAEPGDLFEPADDPVWPDHWRTFPPQWRDLAEQDARRDDVRAVLDAAVGALPETWRTVLLHRDVDGWTYEDVARRLGIPRSHQTLMLHHARARIRAALADYFVEAAP